MRGFSLLEVIFAVAILGIGFAGVIALINRTIAVGSEVTSQLVAANLAQEGIEIIRNIRDTNWIKQKDAPETTWDAGLVDGIHCVQFDSTLPIALCEGEARRLQLVGNRYQHGAIGTPTDFRRYIEILHGTDHVGVRSVVEWKDKSMSVEERLYNWK